MILMTTAFRIALTGKPALTGLLCWAHLSSEFNLSLFSSILQYKREMARANLCARGEEKPFKLLFLYLLQLRSSMTCIANPVMFSGCHRTQVVAASTGGGRTTYLVQGL